MTHSSSIVMAITAPPAPRVIACVECDCPVTILAGDAPRMHCARCIEHPREIAVLPVRRVADVPPTKERHEILLRLLPCSTREIRDARPDVWPTDAAGRRRLERDLHDLGAARGHRLWWPPGNFSENAQVVEEG